uniref:Uncharacterized protein n=1 Tax=Tanacetum cinerariifolium TaxID=118510 RepID=A0A699JB41_TANCI|nr:hypothetical protein [Tanacetum cinerariifolium]
MYIKESLPMKKTDEGVEDGYLGRSQEVNRSGGVHSVDVGGGGHGFWMADIRSLGITALELTHGHAHFFQCLWNSVLYK